MELINGRDIHLVTDYLPTVHDVIKGVKFVNDNKQIGSLYHTGIQKFLPDIAGHIITLWKESNIPTITEKSVVDLIKTKRTDYFAALKRKKRHLLSSSLNPSPSSLNHVEILNELFDIASCKCFRLLTNIENLHEYKCKCPTKKKIPDIAIPFYIDQKTSRHVLISSIAANESGNEVCDNNERLVIDLSTITISDAEPAATVTHCHAQTMPDEDQNALSSSGNTTSSTDFSDDTVGDPDFELSNREFAIINTEKMSNIDLSEIAIICDAKHVSSRAAASIVSATLHAQARAQQKEKCLHIAAPIVPPYAFKSALNRTRQNALIQKNKTASGMVCFQFDRKICDTLVTHTDIAGRRNELKKIEFIIVVKQPGDVFVASVPVTSGSSAAEIFTNIKDHFEKNKMSLQNVVAIGCDGAPVNTGVENGIVRRFEEFLGRPVQWIVCILHLNELIFHRVFAFLDNSSCSPFGYSSDLGHQLLICETLKPVKFDPIKLDIHQLPTNIDDWNLTSDQKYLLEMAKSIDAGNISEKLSRQKPGKMHKARWITTMSRLLRVYVSVKDPSIVLRVLVQYIMKVYLPVLLAIKSKPSFVHGSRHLHLLVSLSKQYFGNKEYTTVYNEIKNVVNNNGYFANSENILLSMITDEDKTIRKEVYDFIITARLTRSDNESSNVRYFEKPRNINFNANHYSQLIKLNFNNISEPPILKKFNFSLKNLHELSCSDDIIQIEEIPSHTQATERYVQVTAQQVKRTSNINLQQGAIHNTASYRKAMPKFDTVKDFQMPSLQ